MSDNEVPQDGGDASGTRDIVSSMIAHVANTTVDAITGIPAPIRKNLLTTVARLCTATVDIPVAYLEGKAKEQRAQTDARVKLIASTGEEIAKQLDVPQEYSKAAVRKYGEKIVRERINVDTVVERAAKHLQESTQTRGRGGRSTRN